MSASSARAGARHNFVRICAVLAFIGLGTWLAQLPITGGLAITRASPAGQGLAALLRQAAIAAPGRDASPAWVVLTNVDSYAAQYYLGHQLRTMRAIRSVGGGLLSSHYLVDCLDEQALALCRGLHSHPQLCLYNVTALPDFADDPNEASVFNKTGFNKRQWRAAGWRKVQLIRETLLLGYSPIFLDGDILMFQDPIKYYLEEPALRHCTHISVMTGCGRLNYTTISEKPWELNIGFLGIRHCNRTLALVEQWYQAARSRRFSGWDQQDLGLLVAKDRRASGDLAVASLPSDRFRMSGSDCSQGGKLCFPVSTCTREQLLQHVALHFVMGPVPMREKSAKMQAAIDKAFS